MSLIIKRKGNAELFSEEKLKRSLQRVFQVTNSELSQEVFKEIMLRLSIQDGMSTRQLQTQVENVLMGLRCFEQARYYIIYRHINYHSRMMTDRVQFMRSYLSAINPATGSKYDANANVTVKNVTTLSGELFKGDIIALNRYRLHEMIQNLYGKDLADEYIYMLEHHFLYKHDESSIAPYCVSITMYPFLLHGLRPLGGLSSQPKGIDSFCGGFINLVFAVSSLFAGAVATGEFLMYFDYFARKDFGEDYMDQMNEFYTIGPKLRAFIKKTDVAFKNFIDVTDFIRYDFQDEDLNKERDELVESLTRSATQEELKNWYESCTQNGVFQWAPLKLGDGSRTLGAYLTQLFQQVVYSMNQPAAARSYQSVFWNISYFDKYYFEGLFGGFYFPDGTAPVWKSLQKLQKVFMKWFNRERTKEVITFPVESFALLTDKDDAHYLDEDSADFVAEMQAEGHSFFVYTSNDPDALASCCRLRNEVLDNSFSYSLGAGGIATGSKSVMTLNLNRLIQEARRKNVNYVDYLRDTVRKVHKFQIAFNELIKEFFKEGALPVYDAGYISMDKQFLTIGVNGAVEAAEFLGMKANPKCKEYQEFINSILEVFYTENKKARTKELMFNTEFVPRSYRAAA